MTVPRSDWPVVVGGCHRSGTSLVRRLLDAHPRIHCGPEVPFFRDFYGDYLEDALHHLRFTQAARSLLSEDELLDVLGRGFVAVHERAANRAGKPRWADKAPENVLYTGAWQRLLGCEWLLVHVVRNPIDTLSSMQEVRFPLTLPARLEDRIAFYRRYLEAGLRFGREHPDRYHLLVYEQVCQGPEHALASLMRWLGERFDPGQLVFNEGPRGNGLEDPKVRLTEGVHASSVGRWQANLAESDAALIWEGTHDLWEQVDPGLRWSYRQPQGCRP